MPPQSQQIMFSTIILFKFVFFSIINCQHDYKLGECNNFFNNHDDELIISLLEPVAKSIENFENEIQNPTDYSAIFPNYKDAKTNCKDIISPPRGGILGAWKQPNRIHDDYMLTMQIKNNSRKIIIEKFKQFMEAIEKPLVKEKENCIKLKNLLKCKKARTIKDDLDLIIMNGKIYCDEEIITSELCTKIYNFLREIGFKHLAVKPSKLETIHEE